MKDRFEFLFYIRKGCIATYRYQQIQGQPDRFSLIPEEGHEFRKFDEKFWKWWCRRFDVVVDESVMDFAFLSADSDSIDYVPPGNFHLAPESCWTRRAVTCFLMNCLQVAEGDFVVWERGVVVCTSPRDSAQTFYLTRINVPKEPVIPRRESTSLYESMRKDSYPPEFIRQIKKL